MKFANRFTGYLATEAKKAKMANCVTEESIFERDNDSSKIRMLISPLSDDYR